MRSSVSEPFFGQPSWIRWLCMTALVLSLCACQGASKHQVSSLEFLPFNAMPYNYRIMNQVRIHWEVREDVAHFCTQAKSMGRQQSYLTPPHGMRHLGHPQSRMHHRDRACYQPCGLGP